MALKVKPMNRLKLLGKTRYWYNALDAIGNVMSLDKYFLENERGRQALGWVEGCRKWVMGAHTLIEQNSPELTQQHMREMEGMLRKIEMNPIIETMQLGEWQVPNEPVPASRPVHLAALEWVVEI